MAPPRGSRTRHSRSAFANARRCTAFQLITSAHVPCAQVEKRRGHIAYGPDTLLENGESGRWQTTVKSSETCDRWASLFDSFVTFRAHGTPLTVFRAAGHQTCAEFTRCVYGIPQGTWLKGMADARKQPGGAAIARETVAAAYEAVGVGRMQQETSTSECVSWWKDLIREWDMIPNETPPVIKFPPYVGETLYEKVYKPEALLYHSLPPLQQKDGKVPGSWFRCRDAAVVELSLDEFGLKEGTTTGEPAQLFKLMARPNHSNFAECTDCRAGRVEKEENIRERRSREARAATNAKQVAHIRECHAERNVGAEWVREANRSTTMIAELDDKLGSWWNFLPMPPNMRFGKATASRWRYKQCIQANLFPGFGNFYSFVPPFLTTGNNFGCTAFCVSLCRLIKLGKVSPTVTHITRQTDRGPDNDGKTTHGLHYILVREGAADTLDWGALRSGHSHNRCTSSANPPHALEPSPVERSHLGVEHRHCLTGATSLLLNQRQSSTRGTV